MAIKQKFGPRSLLGACRLSTDASQAVRTPAIQILFQHLPTHLSDAFQ